jgi:phospholipid/cholesterol/gamma-HCH transport system substrate-binding protein
MRARPTRRLALAALGVVAALVAALTLTRGPNRHTVTAEFTDVRGLVTGAPVRLAGAPVGEVAGVWLGPDGWPRVRLSIDDGVSAARAGVRLASLSGEWNSYVSIVQGPPSSFIPRSQTTSPVQVDQAMSAFDPATESSLKQLLGGLRTTLAGQGPALEATLRESQAALDEIGGLAGDVGSDGGSLSLAVTSSATIASTLTRRSPSLSAAVDRGASLLHAIAERASALDAGLRGLPSGIGAATTTLRRARTLIAPTGRLLSTAKPAIDELPASAEELRGALLTARPALERAARVAGAAPAAARAMTPLLRAAGPMLAVLAPVLRRFDPMLDQLRVRFPDAFSFFANWADFTSNYDSGGHGARVGIVLPPAPTNTLPPDSNGPGQLAPPYLRVPGSLEGQPWNDYSKSFVGSGKR